MEKKKENGQGTWTGSSQKQSTWPINMWKDTLISLVIMEMQNKITMKYQKKKNQKQTNKNK